MRFVVRPDDDLTERWSVWDEQLDRWAPSWAYMHPDLAQKRADYLNAGGT